ncbi:putative sugar kinase [Escherichia coli]|uniref:Putative sugar kinase n=1 Tax=Escherichia coli TaxID=562 RepID=A0A377CVG7_ECOLX|nr:putative sugar kinase [Escherichia coli]
MLGESLIQDARAQDLSPEDLLNKKASCVPPGCNGLMTVLDWLTNPWEPYKRGIMIGFDSSMDYAWIYRSILESVALTLKNNYDNMCNEMNHFGEACDHYWRRFEQRSVYADFCRRVQPSGTT